MGKNAIKNEINSIPSRDQISFSFSFQKTGNSIPILVNEIRTKRNENWFRRS